MVFGLGLAWLALRSGLELRRRRSRRQPAGLELRTRHLRLAKPAVALIAVGSLGGPLSSWWLRDWTPFLTFHAWAGLGALGAFVAVAVVGRRLEQGRAAARPGHARLALLAALLAGLAAASGFVLLP
jgi:hypothetical protein